MKTVYLVRHGQTGNNHSQTSGTPKDELSEKGKLQAKLIAQRFTNEKIDLIITSSYTRAQQTAEAIQQGLKKELLVSDLFIESRLPSEIMGTPRSDPKNKAVRELLYQHWGDKDWHYSDEENFFDVLERAKRALHFLEQRPEQSLLVVTHGAFMMLLIEYILLGEYLEPEAGSRMYQALALGNTGVTVIKQAEDGQWYLVRWNDTVHLDPDIESF